MTSIRELESLRAIIVRDIPALNTTDILRAQVTHAVSTFDKLIHDIVRIGMIEIYNGARPSNPTYSAFRVSNQTLSNILNDPTLATFWIEKEIVQSHGHLAFQDPQKVADALSLVWEEQHKWQKIALHLHMTDKDVKTELKNIVTRRNSIVHEMDLDPATQAKYHIDEPMATGVVNFIEKLGLAILVEIG